MKYYGIIFFCLFLAGWFACAQPRERAYLFLGHPYQWHGEGDRVDARVEALPLNAFEQIWLGGDVCARTGLNEENFRYLDSLFPFREGRAHWAWGNHDVELGKEAEIMETTGRPEFYVEWVDGIALAVLNTNLFQWPNSRPNADFCNRMEAQYEMLRTLADTVRAASHLVILHHFGLLTDSLAGGAHQLDTIFNFYKPFLKMRCQPDDATFEREVYPLLVQIQKKGIPVILVAGDMGLKAKKFAFQTEEGVWFLASGINNSMRPELAPSYATNFDADEVLIFRHNPQKRELTWAFHDLNSLTGL